MSEAYNLSEYPELIRKFCTYKLGIQERSPKTVREYMLDLRTFCRYIYASRNGLSHDPESLSEISIAELDRDFFASVTPDEIYDFIYYAKAERGNGASGRARKLSAIKSFYKYHTQKTRLLPINPAADIEGPKKPKELPKYLSVEESTALIGAVSSDTDNSYRSRDFAIITLFLNCGMRLSELVGITLGDIEPSLKSLRVVGKGAKERVIYLNSSCKAAIEAYLPDRLKLRREGVDDSSLFLSRLGKGISVKTVQHIVKKYLELAGLENKHYSTHKLRHTAATLMYQTGQVDIRILKDILGHEQLNTTQIYTHVADKSMEEAMEKNPLAGITPPKSKKLPHLSHESDEDSGKK